MRHFLLLFLLVGCAKEQPVVEATDTREPIEVQYVGAPELVVRTQPNDAAPVVTKYLAGEAVSVLSRKEPWVEVRTAAGSGWALAADLTTADQARKEEENPTPRFRELPAPIHAPSARGTIYIEASVNTDGDVVSTKLLTNTTGSADLAANNEAALRRSKFHPIVKNGQKQPFLYYHRVDY